MLHPLLLTKYEPARIQRPLLLLILRCRRLPLGRPPHSLGSVLALLACPFPHSQHEILIPIPYPQAEPSISPRREIVRTLLSASLLDPCSRPIPHQPIMRLELLHHLMAVVYQSEAGRFASSELCAETEAGYLVFVGLVKLGELLTEFVFGDVGAVGMEDITGEQGD